MKSYLYININSYKYILLFGLDVPMGLGLGFRAKKGKSFRIGESDKAVRSARSRFICEGRRRHIAQTGVVKICFSLVVPAATPGGFSRLTLRMLREERAVITPTSEHSRL